MNNLPLVSIIVPVFKVETFIERCINSIITQSYDNLEIILVDDGSPDNCPIICDNFAKKDSRIIVIHQENMGLPKARESGFLKSTGDYIYFVDSDDYIHKDNIKILIDHALANNVDITIAGIYFVEGNQLNTKPRLKPGIYKSKDIKNFLSTNYLFNISTSTAAYPQYAWGKLIKKGYLSGYFDISTKFRYWEDIPSTFYLIKKVNSIEIISEPLYYYVIHPQQVTQKPLNSVWNYYIDVWNYLEKTDTDGYLIEQLPQRMWFFITKGLYESCKNEKNYKLFKSLFNTIRKTPIVLRQISKTYLLHLQTPTSKILHFCFIKNYPWLYYFLVKNNIIIKLRRIIKLNN